MPFATARRRPHAVVVGGVLVLHLLLLLGLLRLGTWSDRSKPAPAQTPLLLRLLRPGADAVAPTAAARRGPGPAVPKPQPVRLPQAITEPASTDVVAAPPAPSAITEPPTAAAPAPPPLDLRLHRGHAGAGLPARNPALDDPRANGRPVRAVEDRIAAVLGGGDNITEFQLADGSVMLRRGQSCVVARPNRSQQLDPFNGSVSPKPRLIDHC